MAVKGRYFRPRDMTLKGTGYDSKLEERLHQGPLIGAAHHSLKVPYVWEHTYEPDFVVQIGDTVTMIECKGYFQDRADCSKYLWVRKSLPPEAELIFCFEDPKKAMHFQSKRSDGTKMSHSEWCDKHGFRWYSEQTIGNIFQ